MMRMPTRRPRALLLALLPALLGAGLLAASQPERGFPHARHERLFPVCEGCHAGVTSGEASMVYPAPADCAQCHDGARVKAVAYAPPGPRASSLRYSHVRHARLAADGDAAVECRTCHAAAGASTRMNVGAPQPASCIGCHAHRAEAHLAATVTCSACHAPLARATALTPARIAAFPRPPWHEAADWVSTHGRVSGARAASCATCHARETCERCHANADRLTSITALERDARVAVLEAGRPPAYPAPSSHRRRDWGSTAHGALARRDGVSCANCHTPPSCVGCHVEGRPGGSTASAAIAALPRARPGGAPGVSPARVAGRVHPARFATQHGTLASTGAMQCMQCHAERSCATCHAGTESRAFHAANFVERHAVEVFAGSGSCQSCHDTQTFCRGCHAQSGIAAQGRMNAAFHTGQPTWVLSHGQAARTGMEACASCHRQNDCVRCHSAVGGWRVNPHGPSFRANRSAARNAASCRWCHSGSPGGGA